MPAGRPKGSLNKSTRDIKELAQQHTPKALKTLVSIMQASDSDAARVSAAKELLDRGYGKSTQTIDATITERMVIGANAPAKDAEEWAGAHGPH